MSHEAKPSPLAQTLAAAPIGTELGIAPGELIAGRYELDGLIGQGGMGSVYRVRDRELDELVALKVLRSDHVASPEALDRFRQEVKLARRVTHINVARTYDIGEHAGVRFLTMELVEGESLARLLDRDGALPLDAALGVATQMCAGLIAAHEAGVVHRDLKPENVSVAADGRVVLMDFGIAHAALAGDGQGEAMIGTPAYMAPEQVNGSGPIDARADIYAFGAVLYEMVTGMVAWPGSSPFHVARARLTGPPPDPSRARPELEPGVRALILRCLARAPEQRFPDARALLRELRELAGPPSGDSGSRGRAAQPTPPSARDKAALASTPTVGHGYKSKQGVDGFLDDIAQQRVLMGDRCPPYSRLLDLLEAELAKPSSSAEALFARVWQKRSFDGPYERTLLTLAALRHDALTEGPSHPLYEAIGAPEPSASLTADKLRAALAPDRLGFWITLRSRRIQTNETSRALIWLWPAKLAGCDERRRPLVIADVGASAGLNLTAEALPLAWQRSTGGAIDRATRLDMRARVGFEPRPLDVLRSEDQGWLQACIWPGDSARMVRLQAAIEAFKHVVPAPEMRLSRASSVPAELEPLSARAGQGGLVIAYQSLVRDYIPATERDAYEAGMSSWLRSGAKGTRAWVTLELADATVSGFNCAIDVHVSTGDEPTCVRLGLTNYHPEVVEVSAQAEARLSDLLR